MFLRGLRHSSSSRVTLRHITPSSRSTTEVLSVAQRWPSRKRYSSASKDSNEQKRQDGHTKQGSIRPFTVLALCIPVGWGLSWAFSDRDGNAANSKSPDGFIRYTLERKEPVSSTSTIFTLRPAISTHTLAGQCDNELAIKSIQIKQPQLQIARNYTLLPSSQDQELGELKCLIRKEVNGEVSGYLHRLPIGADVDVRGPAADVVLPPDVSSVIFLSGGTGIAPAMQVADALAGQSDVHILWANRRREDCAGGFSDTPHRSGWLSGLVSMFGLTMFGSSIGDQSRVKNTVVMRLEDLKNKASEEQNLSLASHRMAVDYFVDEEDTFIRPQDVQKLVKATTQSSPRPGGSPNIILVSGPDGFINFWAGPKQWVGGREEQGPLGGTLSKMDLNGWLVVKL